MAWLADWPYGKKIPITGQAGAGPDYQVLLEVHSGAFPSWVSPTGNVDPASKWMQEANIYNGNINDGGYTTTPGDEGYIELTHSALNIDTVRINGFSYFTEQIDLLCDIDLYYDGGWHNIFSGSITKNTWAEKTNSAGVKSVTAARILGTQALGGITYIREFEFANVGEGTHNGIAYLDDLCTDFPNDIRFTDDDGVTELRHCIRTTGDPTTFRIEIADDLGSNQSFYIYYGKSGAGSGVSEFRENYLDYTEVEPDDRIQRTGDPSHHIDFVGVRNEDAYLHRDKGADHFAGDFEHTLDLYVDAFSNNGIAWIHALTNIVDDLYYVRENDDLLGIRVGRVASGIRLLICESVAGSPEWELFTYLSLDTWYYLKFKRVESVGTYGTLYLGIYSTSALRFAGDATDGDVGNLSHTLREKEDFQYCYAVSSSNDGLTHTMTVDVENLYLRFIVTPEPVVGTPGSLEVNFETGAEYQLINPGVQVYG